MRFIKIKIHEYTEKKVFITLSDVILINIMFFYVSKICHMQHSHIVEWHLFY